MTRTFYTSTVLLQIIITLLGTDMKRVIQKKENSNYKSSECNSRFDDTYPLYKYNIVIDYHNIKNMNEERHTKKKVE